VTDGLSVTSLAASLQHKTRVTTDHPCWITLNKHMLQNNSTKC